MYVYHLGACGGRHFHNGNSLYRRSIVFIAELNDLSLFLQQIKADVSVALEEPYFAHLFERDTTGGEISHAAVGKLYARIGYIGRIAHHRYAAGAYGCYRRLHQTQYDVNVMNHQVQYHRHIGAPRIELCQTMRLYKHRVQGRIAQCQQCRIEPFHMPYLYLQACRLAQMNQFLRFF